jgi:protein-S-isoprenylcysteine O-methyltransferase Ste14
MGDDLLLRRVAVSTSALVYWAGVLLLARRVRRQIGRSPNLKPRGTRERLLGAGWLVVILVWLGQPLVIGTGQPPAGTGLSAGLLHPAGLLLGLALLVAGYAGTLWCYASMGNVWRIGINPAEKPPLVRRGPYRRVRHPIYLFQVVLLAGAALLLPTVLSLFILLFHLGCVWIKALDEERYLLGVHGQEYRDYQGRTGRLLPRMLPAPPAAGRR